MEKNNIDFNMLFSNNEKKIINNLVDKNKLDKNFFIYDFVFGFNTEYGMENLRDYLKKISKDNNFVIVLIFTQRRFAIVE